MRSDYCQCIHDFGNDLNEKYPHIILEVEVSTNFLFANLDLKLNKEKNFNKIKYEYYTFDIDLNVTAHVPVGSPFKLINRN